LDNLPSRQEAVQEFVGLSRGRIFRPFDVFSATIGGGRFSKFGITYSRPSGDEDNGKTLELRQHYNPETRKFYCIDSNFNVWRETP
jgi:hypothetical protein